MGSPLVRCAGCARVWHSATLADGLRVVGSCPRCGGELEFSADAPSAPVVLSAPTGPGSATAPHLVLGIPRR